MSPAQTPAYIRCMECKVPKKAPDFSKILRGDAPLASGRIAEALEVARAQERQAADDEVAARAARGGLLADEVALAKNRDAIRSAVERREDTALLITEIEKRHVAALAAEEQERRQNVYSQAVAKGDAAAEKFATVYPKLAAEMIDLLRDLSEAQVSISAANSSLPEGFAPIADPETTARCIAGAPREVISETVSERWTSLDQNRPIDEASAQEIYPVGDGSRGKRTGDVDACYLLARFKRTEYRAAVSGSWALPIAALLRLPSLRGDGLLWGFSVVGHGYDPALAAAGNGINPAATLAQIDSFKAWQPAPPAPRPVEVAYEMVGYVGSTGLGPAPLPYSEGASRRAAPKRSSGSRATGTRR